jgi:hypothetical protein
MSTGMLLFLGAFHGINPGMGWLYAVAFALQENRQSAVWRTIVPLATGHAVAVGLAVLVAIVAGAVIPAPLLRWPIAVALIALGIRRLVRHRHPRWGSMRIGMVGLAFWSFLVATAHGAGLMVLPVWLRMRDASLLANPHAGHLSGGTDLATGLAATAIHAAAYLLVTALVAWLVFTTLGVGILRKAWINLDVIWAAALIVSGGMSLAVW